MGVQLSPRREPWSLPLTCAFGRVSAALDKSHMISLQSSPTLANRIVRSSDRQGSQATPVTQEEWP